MTTPTLMDMSAATIVSRSKGGYICENFSVLKIVLRLDLLRDICKMSIE